MSAPGKLPFVFVLGMHRSGTSCLAGCLERCGVHLGDVSRKNKHNAKGNHELTEVRRLNDRILERCGGSWDAPPARIDVSPAERAEMRALVETLRAEAPAGRPAGTKEPRVGLLAGAWIEAAGEALLVGSFRHPVAVAQSLEKRNGLPAAKSHAAWNRYDQELLALHARRPFPIVEFDLGDPERYCRTIAALALELGLVPDLVALRDFVSAQLDHSCVKRAPVPEECRPLYERLLALRYAPDAAGLQKVEALEQQAPRGLRRLFTRG